MGWADVSLTGGENFRTSPRLQLVWPNRTINQDRQWQEKGLFQVGNPE